MLNDTLRTEIETLRNEYAQRQKAASGILVALKGKSSALAKIQKALETYRTWDGSGSLTALTDSFNGVGEQASGLIDPMSKAEKQSGKLAGTLRAINTAINTTPIDVVRLDGLLRDLRKQNTADERISALFPALEAELDEAKQRLTISFGMLLREGFAAQGVELMGSDTYFGIGRFALITDFVKRRATLNYGKEMVTVGIALNVEAVIKAWQQAVKFIGERGEKPEAWIAQLHDSYQIARRLQDMNNPRVNIIDCYTELVLRVRQNKQFTTAPSKKGLAEYTRAQFAYDFNEIALRLQMPYQGKVVIAHAASKGQTDAGAAKSLWVVEGSGSNDGRYIGDIEFGA